MPQITASCDEGGAEESPVFSVATLLGRRDEPLLEVAARGLVQAAVCVSSARRTRALPRADHSPAVRSAAGERRPLLVSLCLDDHGAGTVRGVVLGVARVCGWSIGAEEGA